MITFRPHWWERFGVWLARRYHTRLYKHYEKHIGPDSNADYICIGISYASGRPWHGEC